MKTGTAGIILITATGVCAIGGCAALDSPFPQNGGTKSYAGSAVADSGEHQYGDENRVLLATGTVRVHGSRQRLSSKAVRLPERPLGEITVYTYAFPAACGGHRFRLYEAEGTKILEYEFAVDDQRAEFIRDYIAGPSPFVQAGLWTAYDHTADSMSGMRSRFEQRGSGTLSGMYSRGLQTSLPQSEQSDLGIAYEQALSDAVACTGAS